MIEPPNLNLFLGSQQKASLPLTVQARDTQGPSCTPLPSSLADSPLPSLVILRSHHTHSGPSTPHSTPQPRISF